MEDTTKVSDDRSDISCMCIYFFCKCVFMKISERLITCSIPNVHL